MGLRSRIDKLERTSGRNSKKNLKIHQIICNMTPQQRAAKIDELTAKYELTSPDERNPRIDELLAKRRSRMG